MKKFGLNDFFKKINYDWKADKDVIQEICRLTKTRVKDPIPPEILSPGMEQAFFLKSVTDFVRPKRILEIGTGRGTGSYCMSLTNSVEHVTTVDVIPFEQKQQTAIGYQAAIASNSDFFTLVQTKEKNKISFQLRYDFSNPNGFDFAFIDGDHSNKEVILDDFKLCEHVLDNNGVIVWDDYSLVEDHFEVRNVVDEIVRDKGVNVFMVEFRGHLFGGEPEKDSGEVLMFKDGVLNENLYK